MTSCPASIWCRLGLHRWPEPFGVGYCERACGKLTTHRTNGRSWVRHVEPPTGEPPRGMPKPPPMPPGIGNIARPAPIRVEVVVRHD